MEANYPAVQEPPGSILGSLRFLGPGLILSAAIVGSGELIATTTLGARHGYTLLWLILLACLFKVALQVEAGRAAIVRGLPTLEGWNSDGGPSIFGLKLPVLAAGFFLLSLFIGMGGVLGGAAQIGLVAWPSLGIAGWTLVVVCLTAGLLFHGKYQPVEWIAVLLNAVFVGCAFYCLFGVQTTAYRISASDIAEGFLFHLPPESVVLAFGVFGIVGVGAGEIAVYPYWCIEKGYAAWTGPNDGSDGWARRARGWIRVMTLDAVISMGVYTAATFAFYLLGAAVLRGRTQLLDGNEFVLQLSRIFTEILGPGASGLFLLGAFTILYSTVFANSAGFARMWADLLVVCRVFDRQRPAGLKRLTAGISCILPALWGLTYLAFQQPLLMVVIMGLANTLFFLVIAVKAVESRWNLVPAGLKPSRRYDLLLTLSVLVVSIAGLRSLFEGIAALFSALIG